MLEPSCALHAKYDSGHWRRGVHRLQLHPAADAGCVGLGRQSRQADLRGKPAQSGERFIEPALCLRPRRYWRPRSASKAAGNPSTQRYRPLRGGKPRRPLHLRARGFHSHQHRRHVRSIRRNSRLLERSSGAAAQEFPLPPRLHRRSVRFAGARRSGVQRNYSLRSEQPVRRLQSRFRSPGARLSSHLWPAHADHELLQQLRSVFSFRKS